MSRWSAGYRALERAALRFYEHIYIFAMALCLAFCVFAEAPSLDFVSRAADIEGRISGWLKVVSIVAVLVYPVVYTLTTLFLVWLEKLRPIHATRNLVISAAVTVVSHATVYHKGYFLLPDPDNKLEAALKFYNSLYFSIVTFTTLGYGDFTPDPPYRLIAALQGIYGYMFLGTLVGTLAAFKPGSRRGSKQENAETAEKGGERSENR